MNIGVIGYSGNPNEEPINSLKGIVYEIGKMIAENNWTLFSGGRDGIMELISKSVKENGGKSIGILPWEIEGNEYLDISIKTGLDFSMRSYVLVKSVDVVISIGGEIGTAIEILGAYANKKPVILIKRTGGWTDRIQNVLIEEKYLDNRKLAKIYIANDIKELEMLLKKLENSIDKVRGGEF
ncbi:TIGR00725 family protein [Marinitoga aeolica]|uniref:TIGR00725 family protein n=1 Tax=Marinitoga aeolica TaxID=2809031 RepID=A0ABY8PQ28_9BACT|nr:TIGR00725 family protein [Marinitoga aeolica]WGS64743.1 TIGR00725 family protein [Marinitoga aeolica]